MMRDGKRIFLAKIKNSELRIAEMSRIGGSIWYALR